MFCRMPRWSTPFVLYFDRKQENIALEQGSECVLLSFAHKCEFLWSSLMGITKTQINGYIPSETIWWRGSVDQFQWRYHISYRHIIVTLIYSVYGNQLSSMRMLTRQWHENNDTCVLYILIVALTFQFHMDCSIASDLLLPWLGKGISKPYPWPFM